MAPWIAQCDGFGPRVFAYHIVSSSLAAGTLGEEGSTNQPLECQRRVSDLIACHVHGIESDSSANAPGNGDLRSHGSGPEPFGADRLATVPSLSWMATLNLPVTGILISQLRDDAEARIGWYRWRHSRSRKEMRGTRHQP